MSSSPKLESLLKDLLDHSLELVGLVEDEDSDQEAWVQVLDERQGIMDHVSALLTQGATLTDLHKAEYLAKVYAIDQKLTPIIEERKAEVDAQLVTARKTKQMNQKYHHDSGYSPYGAFFDKKK